MMVVLEVVYGIYILLPCLYYFNVLNIKIEILMLGVL